MLTTTWHTAIRIAIWGCAFGIQLHYGVPFWASWIVVSLCVIACAFQES